MTGILGISSDTGKPLDGIAHLRQSVRDILTTPRGSRVMRRDYGSDLFELVDQNLTGLTLARIYAATVVALRQWEPRLRVLRVQAEEISQNEGAGKVALTIEAEYLPDGSVISVDEVRI